MKNAIFLAAVVLGVSYIAHANMGEKHAEALAKTNSRIHAAVDARENAQIKSASINSQDSENKL
jgi:hypothetical protein